MHRTLTRSPPPPPPHTCAGGSPGTISSAPGAAYEPDARFQSYLERSGQVPAPPTGALRTTVAVVAAGALRVVDLPPAATLADVVDLLGERAARFPGFHLDQPACLPACLAMDHERRARLHGALQQPADAAPALALSPRSQAAPCTRRPCACA